MYLCCQFLAFLYQPLSVIFRVQGNYADLFDYLDLGKLVQLLLAPAHHFLEKVNVLGSEIHLIKIVHVAQKFKRRLEGLSIGLCIVKRILDLALELCYFFIKISISLNDLTDLNELVRLLVFDLAFPVLVKLREMQELEVSVANFRKSAKDDVLELLQEVQLIGREEQHIVLFIELQHEPRVACERLLLRLIKSRDVLDGIGEEIHHIDDELRLGSND